MLISVVIPIFNEENTIFFILKKLQILKLKHQLEIIIVNDGSTDNSEKIISENKALYNKVIHFKKNLGKGKAVIEGLKITNGEFVFIQDADLEYNPQDIIKFINKIENNNSDLIMGSRFISEQRTVLYFWHMIGNKFVTFLFNILNNTTFTDIYCCYFLFKRKNLNILKLKSYRWGQQAEMLTYLVNKSTKIYEIGVSYSGRNYDEGKKIRYFNVFEVMYWIFITKLKTIINK